MQMKKILLFALLMLASQSILAQESKIETDRPDQTETPSIVPKGKFQMENGFSFEKGSQDSESFLAPSSLLKYGLNDRFEFRLIAEFASEKNTGKTISGLNPILVGFKVAIAEEKGIWPKVSFISHLMIPDLASKALKTEYYAPRFRFTMQHTLTEKISLGYNLGAEWDGQTPDATFIYTLTTGFSLTEKLGCYAEIYGFAPQNGIADHRFDGGLTYLVSNNFMLDASGGFGITENAPDYYAAFGFSFRL